MRNPNSSYSVTILDASNETSNTQVNIRAYNVLTFADDLTDAAAWRAGILGVSRGVITRDSITPFASKFNATVADSQAQRELKWYVRFQDDVTFSPGGYEIACADLTAAPLLEGTDKADLSDPQMAALVTASDGFVKSVDGNDTTVLDITLVGRNL